MLDLDGLPGADLVVEGLECLRRSDLEQVSALVVATAGRRLRALGLPVPDEASLPTDPALRLYARLGSDPSIADPYGRYNALLGELFSFLDAAEVRQARRRPHAAATSSR